MGHVGSISKDVGLCGSHECESEVGHPMWGLRGTYYMGKMVSNKDGLQMSQPIWDLCVM